MNLKPVSDTVKQSILNNFTPVADPKNLSLFCVDGRAGVRKTSVGKPLTGPYLQALGGTFNMAAVSWILTAGSRSYEETINAVFSQLKKAGYRIGAHTGHHSDKQTKSDCGFDDNFASIVTVLATHADAIWKAITTTVPTLVPQRQNWNEVMRLAGESAKHFNTVPTGFDMVMNMACTKHGADLQELEGDHGEVAAVVNLKRNTTLDVDKNQDTQAFNLDLWHVLDMGKVLGLDMVKTMLLTLGLYVATEMVLVEQKRGYGIPIIVNA